MSVEPQHTLTNEDTAHTSTGIAPTRNDFGDTDGIASKLGVIMVEQRLQLQLRCGIFLQHSLQHEAVGARRCRSIPAVPQPPDASPRCRCVCVYVFACECVCARACVLAQACIREKLGCMNLGPRRVGRHEPVTRAALYVLSIHNAPCTRNKRLTSRGL